MFKFCLLFANLLIWISSCMNKNVKSPKGLLAINRRELTLNLLVATLVEVLM